MLRKELRARHSWIGTRDEGNHEESPGNDTHDGEVSRQPFSTAQPTRLNTKA